MNEPLVSIIVTTRNNHQTLDACLSSIVNQKYTRLELIVVDRDSNDGTKLIARYYTDKVFNCGPERSAQRNFGVAQARGEFVVIIDSDMELDPYVVRDCVDTMHYRPDTQGIIIPEESFGRGFWAHCKQLERSYYHNNDAIEAARFFAKVTYETVGGYDEAMVSGEDWDLSARVRATGPIERVTSGIRHNEGRLKLFKSLRKKFYYAGLARTYLARHKTDTGLVSGQGPLQRYKLFLSRPGTLLRHPLVGSGMLLMKTAEYAAGAVGYLLGARPPKTDEKEPTAYEHA